MSINLLSFIPDFDNKKSEFLTNYNEDCSKVVICRSLS